MTARDTMGDSYSRRNICKLIGTGAMTTTLAGCSDSSSSEPTQTGGAQQTDQPTEEDTPELAKGFTWWSSESPPDRQSVVNQLTANFEETNDVELGIRYLVEPQMRTELQTASASGQIPAMLQAETEIIQQLAANDLVSYESAQNVVDAIGSDNFFPGALDLMAAPGDGMMAVPHNAQLSGYWYRTTVKEDLGLPTPDNWDNLLTWAEELHDPGEQYGIGFGSKKSKFGRNSFLHIALSNDAHVLDENANVVFDSDEMIEALEFFQQLNEYAPPGHNDFAQLRQLYQNGELHTMWWSGYLVARDQMQEFADETHYAPYLEKERKVGFASIKGLAIISSVSDNKRALAENFLEYLLTDEEAYANWLHMAPGGMMPTLESTVDNELYRDNSKLEEWGETINSLSETLDYGGYPGFVDGIPIPEIGHIFSRQLVAEAVFRVTEGENPRTVAEEQAEQMRSALD